MAVINGTNGNDKLNGSRGNDTLNGFGGADVLDGSIGKDLLFGDNGNDLLKGSFGNDDLAGGLGSDTLTGGTGADYFVFLYPDEGIDTIRDFSPSNGDKILVSAEGFGIEPDLETGNYPYNEFKVIAFDFNTDNPLRYDGSYKLYFGDTQLAKIYEGEFGALLTAIVDPGEIIAIT